MAKYICPICDRSMEGRYYCSICKSFVKDASLSKADYYLNENHPDTELQDHRQLSGQKPTVAKNVNNTISAIMGIFVLINVLSSCYKQQ